VWSPYGRTLAADFGLDEGIHPWSAATGERLRVLNGPRKSVHALAFAPDGKVLAAAHDGHSLPDSGILVTAEYDEGIVLREVETGAVRTRMGERQQYHGGFAFSPDGSVLAAACPATSVLLWDFPTIRHCAG